MSHVLVTGAGGYLGRHVVDALVRQGRDVVGVRSRRIEGAREDVRWLDADLLDPAAARGAVAGADELVHLAWFAEHGRFWTAPENLDWVGATLRLLRAFAEAGGRRAVCAGSCAEYDWDAPSPYDERTSPLRPATLYGAAKHATRIAAEAYATQEELSFAWGRIFFSFGAGEPAARLVPSVTRALLAGEEAAVTHGRQVRDFIAVEQLADGFVALLDSDVRGAVNLASGRGTTLRELVELIAAQAGRPELVRFGALAAREGEPDELVAATDRLRDDVGWEPAEALADGVARAVAACGDAVR